MRVLMLGWEFPPFISGGLGTACYGLTRALSRQGVDVLFVLPHAVETTQAGHAGSIRLFSAGVEPPPTTRGRWKLEGLKHVTLLSVDAALVPYESVQTYELRLTEAGEIIERADIGMSAILEPGTLGAAGIQYSGDLIGEVYRYAHLVSQLSQQLEFDVIHAHDWMTYPAGLAVSAISGKPLIVHVHSTEFDRSGDNINRQVFEIERKGLSEADQVVCVSNLTRKTVAEHYSVPEEHLAVIYNAFNSNGEHLEEEPAEVEDGDRIVLFLGRITLQKGPEYFLAAAKKVLNVVDNVKFIMAGSGDMASRMVELAARMGIGHKVLFTGFLSGDEVQRAFHMADLYVMPSVSEPFGITPLEAMASDVPVMISRQSGVSEIITHVLKVDFWDVNEMANKIIAVLRHAPLHRSLRQNGAAEVRKFRWTDAAHACLHLYEDLVAGESKHART